MRRRFLLIFTVLMLTFLAFNLVLAHANLSRAIPFPNAVLNTPPTEIRLWFTEPLEPDFSRIFLRDREGNILQTPPSTVDANDPYQLYLQPGNLPNGLYTVVFRVVSAADGHPTQGSYAFIIGDASGGFGTSVEEASTTSVPASLIRWANLLSLSLAVGGLGFWMFVWNPAAPDKPAPIRRRMWVAIWTGWGLVGITGFLLIVLQYYSATGLPVSSGISTTYLEQLIADTRFGHLWLARMALWVGMGLSLVFAATDRWFYPVALALGFAILLTNSLFSHANAARDIAISVGADWLHLIATALWVGGLIQFINVIIGVRKNYTPSAPILSSLVGYFTNFARVSVAALALTGFYAAWLQVGTVDALFTSPYGQALFIKLLLFVPVFGLAAYNMVFTHRALTAGQEIWGKRLRGLVGAEIVITVAMLGAVGVMTSTEPTRSVIERRASIPQPPTPQPISETLSNNDLNVELDISPGWVGENTFTITLTDTNGAAVTDVNLIRMRFESQEKNLGESELRPTHQSNGVYTISGANLSVPGEWRIRTTIQRPDKFDTLVDFRPAMTEAPPPTPPPFTDPTAPLPNRTVILLFVGMGALAVGGFFLGENRLRPPLGSSLLAVGLLVLGVGFLASGILAGTIIPSTAAEELVEETDFTPSPDAPVRIATTSNYELPLPYLMTESGDLLQPENESSWAILPLDAKVQDAYIDQENTIRASTNQGFYVYQNATWKRESEPPAQRALLMHGYVFVLENDGITRLPAGGTDLEHPLQLTIPLAEQPVEDLVMLGDHSHILQNGSEVFFTGDLGLSWEDINAPQPVTGVAVDIEGNLLAISEGSILRWNAVDGSWLSVMGLPGGDAHAIIRAFNQELYAIGNGILYRFASQLWRAVDLGVADVYLTSLEIEPQGRLWALDAKGSRLWSTVNGEEWMETAVSIENP
jgi:copper transport protein